MVNKKIWNFKKDDTEKITQDSDFYYELCEIIDGISNENGNYKKNFKITLEIGDALNVNTQPNTPTTNPKGEIRSGKIGKDFSGIHLTEDTTGVETNQDALNVKTGDNE